MYTILEICPFKVIMQVGPKIDLGIDPEMRVELINQ